jgi:hypothetical protein
VGVLFSLGDEATFMNCDTSKDALRGKRSTMITEAATSARMNGDNLYVCSQVLKSEMTLDNRDILIAGEIIVNSEASRNLSALCDGFGSRFFATKEEKDAAEFMAAKLRRYGLQDAKAEPYAHFGWKDGKLIDLWSWKRGTASLELLKPVYRLLPCISLANAPSTSEEGTTAEVYCLEAGTRTYLLDNKDKIKGKLVLDGTYTRPNGHWTPAEIDKGNLYRPTIYGYLQEFGASGFIYINRSYGDLPPTGAVRFGLIGEIPACGISRESSQFILRQLSDGPVAANLKIKNTYAPGATSYNVVGDLPGHERPEELILVGGHFDGHDISVGAMDDAAGACVVLEAARALAKYGGSFRRSIRFCCFAGEELGLNGSTGYVLNHVDEIKNIKLMINTDMAGISAKTGHSFQVCGPQELASYLEKILNETGSFDREWEIPKITYSGRLRCHSDHWPFYVMGVPTVHFLDVPSDPIDELYSHTTADTVDKVNAKGIKDAAVILALVLARLADEEEMPVKHTPVDRILEALEKDGTAEILRAEKRWRRELSS